MKGLKNILTLSRLGRLTTHKKKMDRMDAWRFVRGVWLLMNQNEIGEWDDITEVSTESENSEKTSDVIISDDETSSVDFGSEIDIDESFELMDVIEESGEVVYVLSFSLGGGTHELLVYEEPSQ